MTAGDGLTIQSDYGAEVANLAINGFMGNGIAVVAPTSVSPKSHSVNLHDLYIGTDPTGASSAPNGLRGIGITDFATSSIRISRSVLSGNTRSGIFVTAGRVVIQDNRIGVKAHSDEPLPNGASGIYLGPETD